jgi:hypothetical protein
MQIARALLIFVLCLVVILYVGLLRGIHDDFRLAHAFAHNSMNSTEATRRELAEATAANHRYFIIEQTIFAMTILCLCLGIILTTKHIRTRRHLTNRSS